MGVGLGAGANNIHGDIGLSSMIETEEEKFFGLQHYVDLVLFPLAGNYAFGNLQNIMNDLMERNPTSVSHPAFLFGVTLYPHRVCSACIVIDSRLSLTHLGNAHLSIIDIVLAYISQHKNPTPSNVIKALPRIKVKAKEEHPEGK